MNAFLLLPFCTVFSILILLGMVKWASQMLPMILLLLYFLEVCLHLYYTMTMQIVDISLLSFYLLTTYQPFVSPLYVGLLQKVREKKRNSAPLFTSLRYPVFIFKNLIDSTYSVSSVVHFSLLTEARHGWQINKTLKILLLMLWLIHDILSEKTTFHE